jgi:segregation and condensation protein A
MYQVTLPIFHGPLDLLLHLIEQRRLDVTQVALAQVTDQYLAHLTTLDRIDPGQVADFLVVAARLILIKSRWLLPRPPIEDEENEDADAGEDLVRQLREYQRFKAAGQALAEREALGLHAYVRQAPPPVLPTRVDLGDVSLDDLLVAVRQALQAKPVPPSDVVAAHSITIADQIDLIRHRLVTHRGRLSFSRLLASARSRLEIIITFLALLELIKQREVAARQDRLFGDILIEARAGDRLAGTERSLEAGG